MMPIPLVSTRMASARRGWPLFFLCALCCVLSTISVNALAPYTQMLWKQACYTGIIACSPTEPLIAAAQGFGDISLRKPDGTVLQTIHSGITIETLAFTPDGHTLAAGGYMCNTTLSTTGFITLWRVSDGACLRTLTGYTRDVLSVAFAPDGQTLASGDVDQAITLWRMSDGTCLQTLTGHTNWVHSVAFAPDGQMLASGSSDNTIKLWRLSDGACLQTLTGHTDCVNSAVFTPDGQTLASASDDDTIKLWQVSDGTCLRTLIGHTFFVSSLAFAPDGQTLASGSYDDTIKLWRVSDGTCLQTLTGHVGPIRSVTFAPDGQALTTGSQDLSIKLWRLSDGSCLQTLASPTHTVNSVAFAPDGKTLASGSDDGTIKLWRASDGACLQTLLGHTNSVTSVVFAPDGQTLASGSYDKTNKLWRVSDGACLKTFTGTINDAVECVAFAPNGQTLASGCMGDTIKLWRISDGVCLHTLTGHTSVIGSVAFAPDGKTLVSGSWDCNIKLWNVNDGTCLQTFTGHRFPVYSVTFAPDGQTLASGGDDCTCKLWRVSDGACLQTFRGNTLPIYSVAFSPDGQTLAAGSYDNIIKLWRVSDGTCIQTITRYSSYVSSVAFAPDGQTLASGGGDGVALWDSLSPLSAVMLSANPVSPQQINSPIALTAMPTGGNQVEYKFRAGYTDTAGWHWSDLTGYVTTASCTWMPGIAKTFTLVVWAREAGHTASYDVYKAITYQVTAPPLTAVALSAKPTSPQAINTSITLTAAPTGGGQVEYLFRAGYSDATGWHWSNINPNYTAMATCTWKPTVAHTYTLVVWVREVGHTAGYDVYNAISYQVTALPLTAVALSANPVSPQVLNTPITLTATPTGGGQVEYLYRAGYSDTTGWHWSNINPNYTTAVTCTWKPTVAQNYTLVVWARTAGHTASYDVYKAITYQVTAPLLTAVALSANPAAPQVSNTTITLTATPTGGGLVEYLYRAGYSDAAGWHWSNINPSYTTAVTCNWKPTAAQTYTLVVWARTVGHTASYDVYKAITYQVTAQPLTAVSLSANPAAPQASNTPITLTAAPTGGGQVEYLYRVGYSDATGWHWTNLNTSYTLLTNCTWTPTVAHSYTLVVWARTVGHTASYDQYAAMSYQITSPPR